MRNEEKEKHKTKQHLNSSKGEIRERHACATKTKIFSFFCCAFSESTLETGHCSITVAMIIKK